MSGLANRQSATPQWRPQGQCPDWTRQVCKTRAPAREPRKKQDSKSFALACAFLRPPVWPSVSCVGGSVFRCGFVVPVCFSARVAGWFLLCGSFLPFVSRATDPETEHFRRQPPSTYAVTEYAATYIVETLGCLLYCAQYNSSQLSRLRPFSLPRIGLSTGLLGNGNDTTACGHPFSQFLRHVAASRPILD